MVVVSQEEDRVTSHRKVTLESETGSFDEHTEVIQAQKLCETNTWKHIEGPRHASTHLRGQEQIKWLPR
jgi:hypothetical protein